MKYLSQPTLTLVALLSTQNAIAIPDGCLFQDNSFSGFTFEGTCDFKSVKKQISQLIENRPGCLTPVKELKSLLNLKEVESQIKIMCAKAAENIEVFPDSDFHDILDLENEDGDEDRFLKEFYDGGTYLNEEYDADGNSLAADTQSIEDFYEDKARTTTVPWPNEEVISNFDDCDYNTVMCCYVQDRQADDDGNCQTNSCVDRDPADNTDICYVDHERSPGSNHVEGGFTVYDESSEIGGEGRAHCHGFAWSDVETDPSFLYRGNTLFYVSMYDHLHKRGYVRNVPGAPMCGCIEQMPTVSEADCTQVEAVNTVSVTFNKNTRTVSAEFTNTVLDFVKCEGVQQRNDLADHLRLVRENESFPSEILAGQCAGVTSTFLSSKGVSKK